MKPASPLFPFPITSCIHSPRLAQVLAISLVALLVLGGSGCAVLVGNVKPMEEKSESYGVMDISRNNPDWIKLDPAGTRTEDNVAPSEVADVAYQSKATASIISLNSACRKTDAPEGSLEKLTNQLFLGINQVTLRLERPLSIQGTPALETTIEGRLNGETVMLQTVVIKRGRCVYDLVHLSRPENFARNASAFSHFVDSLRLK